jgi:Pyruvate/2-oxoacid:ferredoxin oxidoreductase gamma subunit
VRREVRIAGFGGQGVVTLGTILAVAAGIHEDLEVAQTQSYGPEITRNHWRWTFLSPYRPPPSSSTGLRFGKEERLFS